MCVDRCGSTEYCADVEVNASAPDGANMVCMPQPIRIAVIAGDGIGKETMPEGIRVLDAAAR